MIDINAIFKGKTIKSVDDSSMNAWIFTFEDGTQQTVYAECGSGSYDLPYLEIYEEGK